ncbi:MAG: polyamine ABC transporter ATP-binding protein [Deltaproteobacteria bacterium]|nr:MAG: polyamine ABC transporter ATP-binding protein [Deltaproteobacteria bacterium]
MNKDKVIEVKNLWVRFEDETVLEDVSLNVYRHEILVIIGESGCGKSTLMRTIIGLQKPASGSITIDGLPISRETITRKIGVLFQNNALFGSMTIGENIALPIAEYTSLDKSAIQKVVEMKLAAVGLPGQEDRFPSELSGGMKKKAALARALALSPPLLFLDEPSAGLDPVSAADIDQLILNINRTSGTTCVVVTHDLDSVFTITNRVIMLDKKKKGVIAEGTPGFLKNECTVPFVKRFFNRQPRTEKNGLGTAIKTGKPGATAG